MTKTASRTRIAAPATSIPTAWIFPQPPEPLAGLSPVPNITPPYAASRGDRVIDLALFVLAALVDAARQAARQCAACRRPPAAADRPSAHPGCPADLVAALPAAPASAPAAWPAPAAYA